MARYLHCASCTSRMYASPFTSVKRCDSCDSFHAVPPEPGLPNSVFRLLDIARYNLDRERWDEVKDLCRHVTFLDEENPEAYYLSLMAELRVKNLADLEDYTGLFLDKREFKLFSRYGDIHRIRYMKSIGERNLERELLVLKRFRYGAALTAYNNAVTASDYRRAAAKFGKVPDFRDSNWLKACCIAEADRLDRRISRKVLNWFYPYGA